MKSIKLFRSPSGECLAQVGNDPNLHTEINFCDVIGDLSEKTSNIYLFWANNRKVITYGHSIPVGIYKDSMLLDFIKYLAIAEFLTCQEGASLDILHEYSNI